MSLFSSSSITWQRKKGIFPQINHCNKRLSVMYKFFERIFGFCRENFLRYPTNSIISLILLRYVEYTYIIAES